MSEKTPTLNLLPNLTAWGADLEVALCERCQCRFLIPCGAPPPTCPNCRQGKLEILPGGLPEMPHPYPPELVAPFDLSEQGLSDAIQTFVTGIPFAPAGLNSAALRSHLQPVFLPMWLVDAAVSATWQAEAGFDYQVVSHQESYNGDLNQWSTREVKEPRVRWEHRIGRLNRAYQNVAAPAVDDHAVLEKKLGSFSLKHVLPYAPERVQRAAVRLPDNPPKEAWNEAVGAFQKTASAECQQACEANRMRQFQWKAQFNQLNWTLLLLPIYSTCYRDDDGKLQPVVIHGQTGKAAGARRASTHRAGRASLIFLAAGVLLFVLGLLADLLAANRLVSVLSTYILLISVAVLVASLIPFVIAWDFNRRQALEEANLKQKGAG